MTDCVYEFIYRKVKNMLQATGSKVKKAISNIGEKWRNKGKKVSIPAPAPKKPVPPKFTTKTVDFKMPEPAKKVGPFNDRESLSKSKQNRTRAARQKMKKHNKLQKKMNPKHGRRFS